MASNTTRITIDLDSAVQRRLKATAAIKGKTIREYCTDAIERQLQADESESAVALPRFAPEAVDELARLRAELFDKNAYRVDTTELLRAVREERARYLGSQ
ncbi:MAG: hypothetical protein FJ318_05570 [SAR202 cluster bacterium]|nr:hypothetical protein [SAR202 cluster bacterium]